MSIRMLCTQAVLAFALGFMAPEAAAQPSSPTARTVSGRVIGLRTGDVESFKGIPYAAPPVGDLRWRAPQPAARWRSPLQAVSYSDDCQQTPFPGDAAPSTAAFSEDCLYLNIWRPAGTRSRARLPVVVWIHGGGFVNGGSSPAIYAGDGFARDGVLYVNFNYRLGRFGFFAHPALRQDTGGMGNYGVMDQIAALRWVRDNIAAFGGDPGNVTIMGESAGGASVNMLLTSPETSGLFHRAVVQSGGGRATGFSNRHITTDAPNAPSLETLGEAFAAANGVSGEDASAAAALRALPAAAVDNGLSMASMGPQRETYGGPSIDGRTAAGPMEQLYGNGQFAHLPVIVGATSADLGFLPVATKAEAFALFGDHADEVRGLYDPNGSGEDRRVISAIGGDVMMVEPARYIAGQVSRAGAPAYLYRFSYVADAQKSQFSGAPHASEIPYMMDTVEARTGGEATTDHDRAVARLMHQYWVNFARSGDPNGAGLPVWPTYAPGSESILEFTPEGAAVSSPDSWRRRMDLVCQTFAAAACPGADAAGAP